MHINLLPAEVQMEIHAQVALRRWGLFWAICGAGLLAYGAWVYGALREAQTTSEQLSIQCQPLHALRKEIQTGHSQLAILSEEHKFLNQIQTTDHLIDLFGILVRATQPEKGHLQIQRFSLLAPQTINAGTKPNSASIAANSTETTPLKPLATLSLQGVADDDAILARFVSGLRESGVFEHVDLKSSSQVTGGKASARQYELECRYGNQP